MKTSTSFACRIVAAATSVALLLAAPATSRAQTWNEQGDAFPYIQAAQITAGSGPLTAIQGYLDTQFEDADVYCVRLTSTPPANTPLLWMNCVVMQGPNVYLFDPAGLGVATNYDCVGGQKLIMAPNVSLPPGQYYIGASFWGWEPGSLGGAIWLPNLPGQRAPDGPGAGQPLFGWGGVQNVQPINPYTIGLNGNYFTFCDTATPTSTSTWGTLKVRYGN